MHHSLLTNRQTMFDPDVYVQRRARLNKQLESGLLLFLGNDEAPMNYAANAYPFRQDGSFLYYWGLDTPGLAAVMDLDEGREILFGHDPTTDDIVWTGPVPSLQERAERVGVRTSRPQAAVTETVRTAVRQGREVHVLPPYRADHRLKLARWLNIAPDQVEEHVSARLVEAVVAQRSVKSDEEVAEIEKALEITRAMHTLAMHMTAPGIVEQTVAGRLEGEVLAQGGRLAFPITFSVHGEVLHNHIAQNEMQAGDLALCDAGATAPSQYASDVTRVTPVSGRFTERQRAIYEIVLDAQEHAIEAIQPGVSFKEIHLQAARDMTEGMKALGFMKGDVDEAVAAGAHALFFPHGLGHMMGLDVHDMEALGEDVVGYGEEQTRSDQFGLNYLRLARTLEPGFVCTVEPGIYFIPTLVEEWKAEGRHEAFINYDRFEQYRDFGGIRIEDDVLVTDTGHRVLGPPIPKQIEEVEAIAAEPYEAVQSRH